MLERVYVCMYVCVCMCVCVCERERERDLFLHAIVCMESVYINCCECVCVCVRACMHTSNAQKRVKDSREPLITTLFWLPCFLLLSFCLGGADGKSPLFRHLIQLLHGCLHLCSCPCQNGNIISILELCPLLLRWLCS